MPPFLCFLLLAWPAQAVAAETPDMTSALLRTGWALLIVIGLILAFYGLSKKRLLGPRGGNAIKLIEMRPLQTKAALALVEVRGREYLLGVNAQSIQLLVDLSETPGGKPSDFSSVLAEQP